VMQAESAKETAESQLAEAHTTLTQAQAGLAQAQAGKREAQAALDEAEATHEKARLDFERATNLLATQSMTKANYDSAKAQADASQAKVEQARQKIENLQAKEAEARSQINTAQARIAGAKSQVKTSQGRIDEMKAQLRRSEDMVRVAGAQVETAQSAASGARAQLASARIPVSDTALRAPLDAVVLQRNVEVGTFVAAGTVGFVLADTHSVKEVFGVSDVEMRLLRLGMPLSITTEAYPGREFRGRVTAISPSADTRSRVFDVEVTIPNADGRLRPGMIGTVRVGGAAERRAALAPAVPSVPLTAIVRSETGAGEFAVLVVERQASVDVARRRRVELGAVTGNAIAVKKGVALGERVVVSGATLLVDGAPIKVLQE